MIDLQVILDEAMKHVSDVMSYGKVLLSWYEIDDCTNRFLKTFYPDEYKEFFE